ncbi:MAG TPA: hypothetical protein VFY43_06010 [Candidatus Limnocylindria bacterium]|nr:hypothetical protein [Candidatus Limnocylindria bacterium]
MVGLGAIGAVAVVELGRLLLAVVERWPAGAGAIGMTAYVAFLAGAAILVALPYLLPAGRRIDALLLALGLSLTVAVRLAAMTLIDAPLPVDGVDYRQVAISFADGGCCFAERAPGLSLALAIPYAMFGPEIVVHETLNLAAAGIGGWLVYAIVRTEWRARAAASALIAFALTPSLALLVPVLLTETLFITLVLGVLRAVQLAVRREAGWLAPLAAGAMLAAAQYVRPLAPILLPAAAAVPLLEAPSLRRGTAIAGAITLAFAVGVLPIVAHNLEAYGDPSIASSTFGGALLYVGTTQETDGRISSRLADEIRTMPGANQWERSQRAQRIAIDRILDDPAAFTGLVLRKFPIMWGNDEEGVRFAYSRAELSRPLGASLLLMSQSAYVAIVLGAIGGLWLTRRRPPAVVLMIAIVIVGAIGLHALVEVKPRYHAWLIPLFLIVAAPLLARLGERLASRLQPPFGGLGGLGGGGLDPVVGRPDEHGGGQADDEVDEVRPRRRVEHRAGE